MTELLARKITVVEESEKLAVLHSASTLGGNAVLGN
jgi:hypothetical protein